MLQQYRADFGFEVLFQRRQQGLRGLIASHSARFFEQRLLLLDRFIKPIPLLCRRTQLRIKPLLSAFESTLLLSQPIFLLFERFFATVKFGFALQQLFAFGGDFFFRFRLDAQNRFFAVDNRLVA